MPKDLRHYQAACVDRHFSWFEQNPEGAPLFVVPTRGGKSLIIAEFLRRAIRAWPETRAVVLTHVRELVQQNYDEFVDQWGEGGLFAPAGVYSAGLSRRESTPQVVFASIQSAWRRADDLGPRDLALVDEAHLCPKRGMGRYRTYFEALRRLSPQARILGYTATPYRLDGGYLDYGDDRIFTDVAYEVRIDQLVRDGHLVPLVAKRPAAQIDLSEVEVESGEFKLGQMEAAARRAGLVDRAVDEVVEWGRRERRRSWLVFCAGVDHGREVAAALRARGVATAEVYGEAARLERDEAVDAFKSGRVTALVNVLVLTTGFNAPRCDLLAVLRGTHSTALYVQIFGRGMTPHVDEDGSVKKDCLVLDFGGNVQRHGPINRAQPRHQRAGGAERPPPPTKVCPRCGSILELGTSPCPDCGHRWSEEAARAEHAAVAAYDAPYDPDAGRARTVPVSGWFFRRHEKADRPPSLRVDYVLGMRAISEWVCPEHGGYAAMRAGRWWLQHGGLFPPPRTADEALGRVGELRRPPAVEVADEGRHQRVLRPVWDAEKSQLAAPKSMA